MTSVKRTSVIRDELVVGSRAMINNELSGTIRYVGTTSFQTGKWVGVELDEPLGKNRGVVQGKRYFDCKNNHGVFTRPASVKVISEDAVQPSSLSTRRKSIVAPSTTERRKSIVAPSTTAERRKSIVPPSSTTERRKSIVGDAAPLQKRKSIIPSSFSTTNGSAAERKKSTMTPSASPSPPTQRRKSIVAEALPPTKKRPTSMLQTASRTTTIPSSKSTAAVNRKTIVPPKQPTQSTAPIRRARASTFASSPVSILKSRTPITAPTTPDAMLDDDDDEDDQEKRLELEQAEFDNLCLENTNANAAIAYSESLSMDH
ncbi:hypothetical protein [Parasitella parasitica]|uniref:CAP-Gly domain-containing protein n=1 Tax=Parasitella parasitica TaxID=35722 RepID=A0A0B7NHI4_9FUNG|nr:hypothetical protein [Parasitella parasitica]